MMLTLNLLTNILGIALVANWLTWWFAPLEPVRKFIIDKIVRYSIKANMPFIQQFILFFTCAKCMSFWVSLVFFKGNFPLALVTSFTAQMLYAILKKTNNVEE